MNEHASFTYDRRVIDQEVMRRFRENGDVINIAHNMADLNKDIAFWKLEEEISKIAYLHMKDLKKISPYDMFVMKPESYDVKSGGMAVNAGKKPPPADTVVKNKFTKPDGSRLDDDKKSRKDKKRNEDDS